MGPPATALEEPVVNSRQWHYSAAMKRVPSLFFLISLFVLAVKNPCFAMEDSLVTRTGKDVKTDFENFYLDRENLIRLGIGLAGAGILANTGIGRGIRDHYQTDLRSRETDDAAKVFKVPGTPLVIVPVYLVTYGTGLFLRNPTMEEWGQKSIRATVAGAPAVLFLQVATGGSRPTGGDSDWRPFHSSHGVSAHAFLGGVPFIIAAKMSASRYGKGIFYGLSTLPGLSRINDDVHYFSRAALGWYLAYLSCAAIEKTEANGKTECILAYLPYQKDWRSPPGNISEFPNDPDPGSPPPYLLQVVGLHVFGDGSIVERRRLFTL